MKGGYGPAIRIIISMEYLESDRIEGEFWGETMTVRVTRSGSLGSSEIRELRPVHCYRPGDVVPTVLGALMELGYRLASTIDTEHGKYAMFFMVLEVPK